MNAKRVPAVFVSSTCYDLSQVRANLREFIEHLGYEPVLSEYESFPVDSHEGTIDNCLNAVEAKADVFVLVVGNRYGSLGLDGQSVTNMEYLKAKAKGIPIYVFVLKKVYSLLPVWRDNPDGNFSSAVESNKVLAFIDDLTKSSHWIYPFETANDITSALRIQFAYQHLQGLELVRKFSGAKVPDILKTVSPNAFKLAMEKPIAWEGRLFSQVACDEIAAAADLRRDLTYGISFEIGEVFDDFPSFNSWIRKKLNEFTQIANSLDAIGNKSLQDAMGQPGEPGDIEHLVYTARRFVDIYKSAIRWAIRLRSASIDESCQEIIEIIIGFATLLLEDVEAFAREMQDKIARGLERYYDPSRPTNERILIDLNLTMRSPDLSTFDRAITAAAHTYVLRQAELNGIDSETAIAYFEAFRNDD